jgi:mono/diheme cytochrome c family protein
LILKRYLRWVIVALIALFILIQVIPYGRDHTNPSMTQEPAWDSPRTRQLAAGACFDCHSNETVWPWYSNIAPVSWLVQRDVEEGRSRFNFSTWDRPHQAALEAPEVVSEGEMPPWYYALMHKNAQLTSSEKDELVRGLQASVGGR